MDFVTLNTGAKMPLEGFGAMMFDPNDAGKAEEVIYTAIKRYRCFLHERSRSRPCNQKSNRRGYRKERGTLCRIKAVGAGYDEQGSCCESNLDDNLGLDCINLYLEHQAMGDYFAAWRAMEDAYKAGKLKAIGVANFFPNVLCNFCETVEVTPAVNQVELNPFFTQEAALANMKNYGVQPMAWSPLAEGKHGIFTDPEMTEIGKKYGKTAAQVALRWNTQRGVVIIPKSSNPLGSLRDHQPF